MNTIYLKTPKAEIEGAKLAAELRRVLTLLDGRTGSDELAKRAAPSLRIAWSEIIGKLVKEGYIVSGPRAIVEAKHGSAHKAGAAASANDLAQQKMHAAEQVIAALETAAAADKARSDIGTEQVIAALETLAAADKAKSDVEAKAKAVTPKKAEITARTAELKTFFATAKQAAATESKQPGPEAAHAAAAREKLDAEARSSAAAKTKERENARTYVELETAIRAAKTQSDMVEKAKTALRIRSEMHVKDTQRIRDLETEAKALKQLLVEAYVEIAALKTALGLKT